MMEGKGGKGGETGRGEVVTIRKVEHFAKARSGIFQSINHPSKSLTPKVQKAVNGKRLHFDLVQKPC